MAHKVHSNERKQNYKEKKVKPILTDNDVICSIAVITLAFQAITTLMTNGLSDNPYAIISYGVIAISFSMIIIALCRHKKV